MAGSDAQRFAALQHANEVRVARAELKRRSARTEVDVLDVLRRPPAEVRDMPLADILPSVPKVGKKKADRIVANLLRSVADQLDPVPKGKSMTPYWHPPRHTLFDRDENLKADRAHDAASLLDDDVLGYVQVRAVRVGNVAEMRLGIALEDELWPAMNETLLRVIIEAERVHA
jgi:hypothetical protein